MTKLLDSNGKTTGILKLCALKRAERRGLAVLAGTTIGTVDRLCYGKRPPGVDLAMRIEKATRGKITCRELRPDLDWDLILAAFTADQRPQS